MLAQDQQQNLKSAGNGTESLMSSAKNAVISFNKLFALLGQAGHVHG